MSTPADPRPFAGAAQACVVLPAGTDPETCGLRELLVRERFELEVELGAPVAFRIAGEAGARAVGAMPTVYIGPSGQNAELAAWRSARGEDGAHRPYVELADNVVVIDAPDGPASVSAAASLLRTAVRRRSDGGNAWPRVRTAREAPSEAARVRPEVSGVARRPDALRVEEVLAADLAEAVDRMVEEIGTTYPSFGLRGIDWQRLVEEWRPRAARDGGDLDILQRWVARLRDPHTSVRTVGTRGFLPYTTVVDGRSVRLSHVPRWSVGWEAGARPGDVVVAVDDPLDPEALLATSAGEERTRPWFAGRRAMTVVPSGDIVVEAHDAGGRVRRWREAASGTPWAEPVSWTRLPSGTGYLRIRAWRSGSDWAAAVDAALAELARCPRLIVDVRGNVGGNLVAAQWFRDCFLVGRTTLGSIRFSVGDGTLSPSSSIESEPTGGRTWDRPVRFLLDRLSYSATEDALLGLRDLDHVQFYGEPSGGGSGRPRTVALRAGEMLSVSTALTYERSGRCVEGRGLGVDVELASATLRTGDAVLAADTSW